LEKLDSSAAPDCAVRDDGMRGHGTRDKAGAPQRRTIFLARENTAGFRCFNGHGDRTAQRPAARRAQIPFMLAISLP
jgi:hypothetical protein